MFRNFLWTYARSWCKDYVSKVPGTFRCPPSICSKSASGEIYKIYKCDGTKRERLITNIGTNVCVENIFWSCATPWNLLNRNRHEFLTLYSKFIPTSRIFLDPLLDLPFFYMFMFLWNAWSGSRLRNLVRFETTSQSAHVALKISH